MNVPALNWWRIGANGSVAFFTVLVALSFVQVADVQIFRAALFGALFQAGLAVATDIRDQSDGREPVQRLLGVF